VLALLVFEVFFSRRAWCRYACPIGLTYGVVGIFSPVRIKYNLEGCFHEGDCRKVCLVPHVLDTVIKGRAVRHRGAARPRLHALRPVRGHLPDRFADLRRQGPVQAAVKDLPLHDPTSNVQDLPPRNRVLDGIGLDIGLGERVALIGSNGAGKTTLIRCLLGEYTHEGEVPSTASTRAASARSAGPVGFVPQLPPPLKMPVGQLIDFAAALCGTPGAHRTSSPAPRPRRGEIARPFVKLSGGMKQKLLIAIALGRDAKLLVMDEPAANLDPEARKIFFELLAERQQRRTMLISSHRLNEVAALVNRVVELDMGKVVLDDRVADDVSLSGQCSPAASASSASSRPSPRRSGLGIPRPPPTAWSGRARWPAPTACASSA
jgi:ABC-2 type transport system ATP-binding protein